MEVNLLSIILVKSDSKGDRLLFRYPFDVQTDNQNNRENKKRGPYSVRVVDDILQNPPTNSSNITKGVLTGFSDEVLSTLFAVKSELCNQKFELKVNDVRFVSHPTLMQSKEGRTLSEANRPQQLVVNVVFALYAQASYSIVKCHYELSKKLGMALSIEENRVGYLTDEMKLMVQTLDEVSNQMEQEMYMPGVGPSVSVFDLILGRSSLAQCLKSVYHDLCTTGILSTIINEHITLSFCMPQKAHQFHKKGSLVEPDTIDRCLQALKPYHGMLLLDAEFRDCVHPQAASMLDQLIEVYSALKSLQNMAVDAELPLEVVYEIVGHLVYWAKATIIYPLCETNVYVIAPDAPLHTRSHLVKKFSSAFPGMSLLEVISDFSLPTSIGHLTTPLQLPARQGTLAQMVLWMLQHQLLIQLHTYVQFMPSQGDCDDVSFEYDMMFSENDENRSLGQLSDDGDDMNAHSLMSISSQPLPVPNTSRRSITEDHFSGAESIASDNIALQPSSSHKSNFSMTHSTLNSSSENCDSLQSIEDEEKLKELLNVFQEHDRSAIKRIPASATVEDLALMVKLYQAGYFKGEHHLEEIMYFENLRRSQLLQLLDKFRDVLIIYETEDPAIASLYSK